MKMSLKNSKSVFADIKKRFESKVEDNLISKTKAFVAELEKVTPVDTGKARAAWEITRDQKDLLVKNSTDYIQYLNQGSSKQAPSHFVERTAINYGTPKGTIVESVT